MDWYEQFKSYEGPQVRLLSGRSALIQHRYALEVAEEMAGNRYDVTVLESQEGKQIGIDQVRDALGGFRLTPSGRGRVLVVLNADHALGDIAAQALLKTLEESPKSARFILTATRPGLLLPTIRSRCVQYKIPHEMGERSTVLARISQGVEEQATELQSVDLEKIYQKLLTLLVLPAPWPRQAMQELAEMMGNYQLASTLCLDAVYQTACVMNNIAKPLNSHEQRVFERYGTQIGPLKRLGQVDQLLRTVQKETRLRMLDPKQAILRLLLCLELPLVSVSS